MINKLNYTFAAACLLLLAFMAYRKDCKKKGEYSVQLQQSFRWLFSSTLQRIISLYLCR